MNWVYYCTARWSIIHITQFKVILIFEIHFNFFLHAKYYHMKAAGIPAITFGDVRLVHFLMKGCKLRSTWTRKNNIFSFLFIFFSRGSNGFYNKQIEFSEYIIWKWFHSMKFMPLSFPYKGIHSLASSTKILARDGWTPDSSQRDS